VEDMPISSFGFRVQPSVAAALSQGRMERPVLEKEGGRQFRPDALAARGGLRRHI
jgi:hypothetical protein